MKNNNKTIAEGVYISILSQDYGISENKIRKLLTLGYDLDTIDQLLEFESYEELRDRASNN